MLTQTLTTLAQLMAWCLIAPSHHLIQCWLTFSVYSCNLPELNQLSYIRNKRLICHEGRVSSLNKSNPTNIRNNYHVLEMSLGLNELIGFKPVSEAMGTDSIWLLNDLILTLNMLNCFNSLAPRRFKRNFREVILKLILVINGWSFSCKIVLKWMPMDLTNGNSSLVQVMAWCW